MDLVTTEVKEHPFMDVHNPQHFINLVTSKLRDLIFEVPHRYFEMAEDRLIAECFMGPPDEVSVIARLNFWEEYNSCFLKLKAMKIENIVSGLMSPTNFYRFLAHNPARLAFIIREPVVVQNRLKYAYKLALDEVVKKLAATELISPKTGLPDPKLQQIKVDLFKYLDQRLHGSLIQRIEQKTVQVNIDGNPQATPSADNIDEKLKAIEAELSNHNALPPAIDVTSVIIEQTKEEVRGRNGS